MIKKRKYKNIFCAYIFLIVFLLSCLCNNVIYNNIGNLPENFYTNLEEVELLNKEKTLGNLYNVEFKNDILQTGEKDENSGTIIFKLFGIIPIKKVKVEILPEEEVYIGGVPIGLNVSTKGAIVVSNTMVDSKTNKVFSNKILKNGDVIIKINNQEINNIDDINTIIEEKNVENKELSLTILRNNKEKTITINCIKDNTNSNKLGVWVRDDLSGIGTLTFVNNKNDFAALGHPITDSSGENTVPIKDGQVYSCSLLGVEKGKTDKPGQLKCLFVQSNKNGIITKNTKYGIIGQYQENLDMIDANLTAKVGGRLSVKPGKATIVSSVSGIREEYEIEIIKANSQKTADDKSIVFRVTDKRLLELTGGIVQGMSGSPILQNGKLIGAVTHVFLKDPTKGYGVYIDWMLKEIDK